MSTDERERRRRIRLIEALNLDNFEPMAGAELRRQLARLRAEGSTSSPSSSRQPPRACRQNAVEAVRTTRR